MHIHLVAKHDSMCCAGRHACHAAVLKQTAPVLVLVLDFQFFEFFSSIYSQKITALDRVAPQRQVLLLGCQVNTADNQIDEPSLVPTMLVMLSGGALAFWSEPGPSACQSRWTWDQAWLVFQPSLELSRSKCGVGCATRASQSGLDALESHRSPPHGGRKPGLQPSRPFLQIGSCGLSPPCGGDL